GVDLVHEERPACSLLERRGLVLGRYAADGIGDPAPDQFHTIVGFSPVIAPREAVFDEARIEEFTRIVAGERPPRAVCAAQARGQSDDEERRVRRAEGRYRA